MRIGPSSTPVVAALVLAAAVASACAARHPAEPFTLVTIADVAAMLGNPRVAIVDANPYEIFQAGHVPGARWYRAGPTLASVLPADRTEKLVFYCASPG